MDSNVDRVFMLFRYIIAGTTTKGESKMTDEIESREARHGERTIEINLRFWTDNLAEEEGHILPGNCWSSGVIGVPRNRAHDIGPTQPQPFNSLMEIPSVLEQIFIEAGIEVHIGGRMARYIA